MKRFLPLLLDVWKEACRHIEIDESAGRIAAVLVRRLPLAMLVVRRLDFHKRAVETVGVGVCGPTAAPTQSRSACSQAEFDDLLAWCRAGGVLRGPAVRLRDRWPGLLPSDLEGEVLAGPLNQDAGAAGVLILVAAPGRPFTSEHEPMVEGLLEPLAAALENDGRVRELRQLREAVEADNRSLLSRLGRQDISDSIVGAETGLASVMERVELVAQSDVPVLILGETGSGKEVVARAIHRSSPRSARPFLRVNCGAIPPELIDSELFGHERGSFTGATSLRRGWFERADGGTLFLDEVGELPPAAQVRLLRILQDGSFDRVGGQRPLHVDVRVVAATNCDLRAMVSDGRFREDLWYRIAVFIVRIPPLRERREDIPPLAAHFALRAAKRLGMPALVPGPSENDMLVNYAWPGNVRELSAVIERAAILGNGKALDVAGALGLDTRVAQSRTAAIPVEPLAPVAPPTSSSTPSTLDQAMVVHIEDALRRSHGRVEGPFGAARLLGINPNTLRSKMRKLGIVPRAFKSL